MPDPRDGGVANQKDVTDGADEQAILVGEKLIAEILAWWNQDKSSGKSQGQPADAEARKKEVSAGGQSADGKAPVRDAGTAEGKGDQPGPVKLDYHKPGTEKQAARPALPPEKDPQVVGERQETAARNALAESHKNLKFTQDNSNPRVLPYRENFPVTRAQTPIEISREQLGTKATRDQVEAFAYEINYLNKRNADIYGQKIPANSIIRLPGQTADGGITSKDGENHQTRWHNNSYLVIAKDGHGYVTIPENGGSERTIQWNKGTLADNSDGRRTGNIRIEKYADGSETQRQRATSVSDWQIVRSKLTDDKGRTVVEEYSAAHNSARKVTVTDKNNVTTTFLRNSRGALISADGKGITSDSKIYRQIRQADGTSIRAYEDGMQERYDARGNILVRYRKDEGGKPTEEQYRPGEKEPHAIRITMKPGQQPLEFARTAAGRYVADFKNKDGRTIGTIEAHAQGQFEYTDKVNQVVRKEVSDGRIIEQFNLPHTHARTVERKGPERLIVERDRNDVVKSETYENSKDGRTISRKYDATGKISDVVIADRDSTARLHFDRDLGQMRGERTTKDGRKERVIFRDDQLIFPDSRDANGNVRIERMPVAFAPSPEPAIGKYNADSGTISYPSRYGGQKIDSVAPGRTDVLKPDGTVEGATATGEKSYVKPSGEAAVEHADGSKVRLNPDGTTDRWGPTDADGAKGEALARNEKAFLEKHRGSIDLRDLAEIHRRFRGDRSKLDGFYDQLSKIDDANNLSPTEKQALRRNIMRHVAHPAEISQGIAFTCNVSVVQRDQVVNNPAKYAALVVSAVSDGSMALADGTIVKFNQDNLKLPDATGRDLASRIFQGALLNVVARPGSFLNTEDGVGKFVDKDGNRIAFDGLPNHSIADLLHRLTGQEQAFVKISTAEDLRIAFEKNGGGPMILNVDGSKQPIAKESSPGHGAHVVTVTRIENGPPMKVYVQNQWGLENDHSTPERALTAEELIENIKRRDGNGRAIIRGARLKVFKVDGRNLVEDKDASKAVAQEFEAGRL